MSESSNVPDVPALAFLNLFHKFKYNHVLKNVTFSVARNSIHGFVGPNGAGKTTTLKLSATILRPQGENVIKVFGRDVGRDYVEVRKRIGFMPDYFTMYKQMTVFEYLDFFAAAYGLVQRDRDKVIGDLLDLTDMGARKNDRLPTLSRGMQQRVSLARVLVHDPELLLLDEPASGLDPRARIELMEILKELQGMGKTIFISSHILSELADLCDSVTIIDTGTIKYSGPIVDLLRHGGAETQVYRIGLKEACPAAAEELKRTKGVIEVATERDGLDLKVSIDCAQASTNSIIEAAMKGGAQIAFFKEEMKHLNQVFLDLTSRGKDI